MGFNAPKIQISAVPQGVQSKHLELTLVDLLLAIYTVLVLACLVHMLITCLVFKRIRGLFFPASGLFALE